MSATALMKRLTQAAQTGNNTHAGVGVEGGALRAAVQFVVEAIGATPTVTWKVQGSMDGSNWYDVEYLSDSSDTGAASTRTATTVGAQIEWLDLSGGSRFYLQYRIVTTLNTNVTYHADLYLQP